MLLEGGRLYIVVRHPPNLIYYRRISILQVTTDLFFSTYNLSFLYHRQDFKLTLLYE